MRSGGLLAVVIALGGCTPQEPRYAPEFDPVASMGGDADNADTKKAKQLIEQAVAQLRDGQLEAARKSLSEAERFADELKREEIRSVRQNVDSTEADGYAPGINKLADEGKCDEAIDTAAEIIEGRKDTAIPVFVRERTSKHLLKCLLGQLKIDLSIGRELADSDEIAAVLSKQDLVKYQAKVTEDTVEELIGRFSAPLDAHRWADAKALLDELMAKKEAGPREYDQIMDVLRKGIAADIAQKVDEALEEKTGIDAVLTEVDGFIAIAEWGKKKQSAVGGAPMPKAVQAQRDTLALWKACTELRCSMTAPAKQWAYGDLGLHPPLSPSGAQKETIEHATPVWRLAESAGWALIAREEPKEISDVASRVPVAWGWVKSSGLKGEDTAAWLPPGDAIIGTRVWGPLREGQKELELGTVIKTKDQTVAVERLADRTIVEVPRSQVRFGSVDKGTKVLARCVHPIKLEPAIIESVKFPPKGDPVVTYSCVAAPGDKRDDQLGAVRAKATDLPARK